MGELRKKSSVENRCKVIRVMMQTEDAGPRKRKIVWATEAI